MVTISKISADWVTKGCHLHVGPIELVVRPDHQGSMVIRKWFQSTSNQDADVAIRQAWDWLGKLENRQKLFRDIERARTFVRGDWGILTDLACGRGAEFTFLLAALKRLGV